MADRTAELMQLYAQLAEQREELVNKLDEFDSWKTSSASTVATNSRERDVARGRLNREIRWRESQIVALLGGIVHWEYNG